MAMTLKKLVQEIQQLNQVELAEFRRWFRHYDDEVWDRQIEEDVKSGKLDLLAQEAREAHAAGKSKEL